MTRRRVAAGGLALAVFFLAGSALAERAYVRGAPLNVRSGPGTEYRIISAIGPGEGLDILQRAKSWTRIRTREGKEGWISAGYLDAVPPPKRRLEQAEAEVARLKAQLEATDAEASTLRDANAELSGSDEGQRSEIERLTRENYKLRAGQRWAEWILGASILGMGMVAGAILSRVSTRRGQRRLRL